MSYDVICLRPAADFLRAGVIPPAALRIAYRTLDDSDMPLLMATARAAVVTAVGPRIPASLFENSAVKLVQVTGAGVDRLDEPALKRLGIAVCNVSGGSNAAMAEYVVTVASMLLRRFVWADHEIRAGNYQTFRTRMFSEDVAGLEGLAVGIIGLGTIGLVAAQAFHAMRCRILYVDPAPRDTNSAAAIGAQAVTLEELLRASDVVSVHVPLLPSTRGMIGDAQFAAMKPGALLIQASRGGVVDEAALIRHLASGHLGGAAVDVYSQEPPPEDNPLFKLQGEAAQRLLLTPHIAGVTRQAMATLLRTAWENVERVLVRGEPPPQQHRVY